MTDPTPDEAAASLQAVLDVLDAGGRHCGCDPDLYGDGDFIGVVSDSQGNGHREVHGTELRVLLAERDRLRAENRLLRALQQVPTGSCHRTTIHPAHRWLPSPTTQHCPGLGPDSTPAEEHLDVTVEYGFENMDRGGEGPMMIGRPVDEIRAVMADKRATFPEVRYALRRRLVGPWESVGETQSTHAQPGDHDD